MNLKIDFIFIRPLAYHTTFVRNAFPNFSKYLLGEIKMNHLVYAYMHACAQLNFFFIIYIYTLMLF